MIRNLPPFLDKFIHHPVVRYSAAFGWTVALVVTLLQSSSQPVVGPAAPPGDPDPLREVMLTTAHMIGFGGLTLVWWWALVRTLASRRALMIAVMIALVLGTVTELLQVLVADRNASWDDFLVNWATTLVCAWLVGRYYGAGVE